MELEGCSWPTCSKQPRLDCRIGVVNKLDRRRRRRRVLLTTRSTCRGEIFQVRSSGQSARGKYANFWRYANFLTAQCGIDGRKPLCQNPARFVQSFRYNTGLWRTDGLTHDDCIHCASIASRDKKQLLHSPSISQKVDTSAFSEGSRDAICHVMQVITSYSIWSHDYVCRPIWSFCSCLSCFCFFDVFMFYRLFVWSCFFSDILLIYSAA